MMPGPDRPEANHGGKVFLPPSALDKLTRLHIMYPMLFEVKNNKHKLSTHAGVLEFTAEEGKVYLPYWLMQTIQLEPGNLVQIQSTELSLGSLVKLQPQDPSFLEISDPKAVLQRSLNNLPCLTVGDIFTFEYNDTVYSIAVLEVKPEDAKKAICIIDVDLNVDFAPPLGYEEPVKKPIAESGTSTPRSGISLNSKGGIIHPHGTMAQAINYSSIAPESSSNNEKSASSNFLGVGNRVAPRKGKGVAKAEQTEETATIAVPGGKRGNGPYPLRIPPGKLFLGYEIKPVKKREGEEHAKESVHFQGQGQSLRKKKGDGKP
jgi:ubiquitin fusion degradation protein 1